MAPTEQSAGNEFRYLHIFSNHQDFFNDSSCIILYSQWPKGSLLLIGDDWQNNDLQFPSTWYEPQSFVYVSRCRYDVIDELR